MSQVYRLQRKSESRLVFIKKYEVYKNRFKRYIQSRDDVKAEHWDNVWMIQDRWGTTSFFIIDVDRAPYLKHSVILKALSPVLVISNQINVEFAGKLIRLGAAGVLSKNASHKHYAQAFDRMLKYGAYLPQQLTHYLLTIINSGSLTHAKTNFLSRRKLLGLTQREFEVYELMVQGKTNREISQELYLSPHTVKHHVHHIQKKLGVINRIDAVTTAYREGWVEK